MDVNQFKSRLASEQVDQIKMILLMNKLTKGLENYEFEKLVEHVKVQKFKADEKIIKFGD